MDEKPKTHKQVMDGIVNTDLSDHRKLMDGLPDGPKNEPSLADMIADKPDKEHNRIMVELKTRPNTKHKKIMDSLKG
ncbi:MAG TPA: hypothetical protein PLK39_03830 [Methanofastidiosum sp.]|nr:hypothetical protein [Methanofastidiosum sp.]